MVSTATVTSGGKWNILTESGKREMNGVIYRTSTEIHGRHADTHYFKFTHHILVGFKKQKDNSHVIAKSVNIFQWIVQSGTTSGGRERGSNQTQTTNLRFGLFKASVRETQKNKETLKEIKNLVVLLTWFYFVNCRAADWFETDIDTWKKVFFR